MVRSSRLRGLVALAASLVASLVVLVVLVGHGGTPARAAPPQPELYERHCLACHGAGGDGKGPAAPWLLPRPADFTTGRAKWRTTAFGQPATRADLTRTIREGLPGTSMPGFAGILDAAQIDALVTRVQGFAPRAAAPAGAPITLPPAPDVTPELVARGRARFASAGCVACHGESGRGDGLAAPHLRDSRSLPAQPRDLTATPLRRGATLADIATTLATGVDGTPMPAVALATDEDRRDLWALAAYVDAIRARGASRGDPTVTRALPGDPAPPVGLTIPPQGPPPHALAPAAASLSAAQCGRCHAKQVREWTGTVHARAGSPGLYGQLVHSTPAAIAECQRCHAPLAEALPGAAGFVPALRHEGINCASCHVRGWTRHGPPRASDSRLLALPTYPFVEDAGYERSDFCLPCHQLPPSAAVNGRPLLNTYREWLEGPYMARGVQCQHCHMPDREHTFRGIHDRETVRQGLDLALIPRRTAAGLEVVIEAKNVGAGHYLPTTPTPAIFLDVEVLGEDGDVLERARRRIGRHIRFDTAWRDLGDTPSRPARPGA